MGEIEFSERPGGVGVVRLNRPDRLNALTPDMVRLITEAMEAGQDHRAIVITGSGRGFCAGVDIAGALADVDLAHVLAPPSVPDPGGDPAGAYPVVNLAHASTRPPVTERPAGR